MMDPMRRVLTAAAGLAAALVLVCVVTVPDGSDPGDERAPGLARVDCFSAR